MQEGTPEGIVALGKFALEFSRVERVCFKEDGITAETDTDHTVMLGLIACSYAAAAAPHLDLGKIAQFALVHDLVETYAGDTNTFGTLSDTTLHEAKKERERLAFARIQKEFDATLPWITNTIHEYETLESPEARFVKLMDKITPKITRLLNNNAQLGTLEQFEEHCKKQLEIFRTSYGADQPEAIELYEKLTAAVAAQFKRSATNQPEASQASA